MDLGTWVQQGAADLQNYMDAVIHDGIIEVTHHPEPRRMATPFWAGTFEARHRQLQLHFAAVDHAVATSEFDKETKEFVMRTAC